jgi:hypothetical protein
MKRAMPMALLLIGLVLAGAFGARNGDTHTAYRTAEGAVALAEEGPTRERAVAARDAIGLPQPGARIVEWFRAGGLGFFVGVLMIGVGAVLARRQLAAENSGEGGAAGRADFAAVVASVRSEISRLQGEIAELPFDDDAAPVREALDQLQFEVITPLVDARGQLIARHGLAKFATYFGPFSGGERNLSRCWSALTDGHAEVARDALVRADALFTQAEDAWNAL